MRTLILSDIHHKVQKVEAILSYEPHDRAVLLGDYFDNYEDNPEDARRAAIWLKDSLERPERIHLVANHDWSYMFPYNRATYCSGYSDAKALLINQVLTQANWDKLRLYHVESRILFSHAGVSTRWLNRLVRGAHNAPKTLTEVTALLDQAWPEAKEAAAFRRHHAIFDCGFARGGRNNYGGPIWNDHDLEAMPMAFPQIVGHTHHPRPDFLFRKPDDTHMFHKATNDTIDSDLFKTHWWQFDIDTGLNHYAVLEDDILSVREVSWLKEGVVDRPWINYTHEVFERRVI